MIFQIALRNKVEKEDKNIRNNAWTTIANGVEELVDAINNEEINFSEQYLRCLDPKKIEKVIEDVYFKIFRFNEHLRANKDNNPTSALNIANNLALPINIKLEELGYKFDEQLISLESEDTAILEDLLSKSETLMNTIREDFKF